MRDLNILFISTDQLRADCVGFARKYPVKTPNIDRLAAGGTVFTHAYTPLPTCCPARQALLCGSRPERFGALWNYDQGIPVASVEREAFSWARELREAGYRTGYVGKWHVSPVYTPLDYGYEDYVSREELEEHVRKSYPQLRYERGFFGEKSPVRLEDSETHQTASQVIRLMESYKDQPWHIKMDFSEPHLPCRPSEPFASMYGDEDVERWRAFDDTLEGKPYIQRQMRLNWGTQDMTWEECRKTVQMYYGIISQMDDAVGRVLSYLEESGMLERTVIIFTADHGDFCGDRRMMDKHYVMYEEVTRVPLVIWRPGEKQEGRVCDSMVVNMLDLVPTILELAGIPVAEPLDGISLVPCLRGERQEQERKYALVTYNGQQFGLFSQRMICDHRYKYVWNPADTDELYDLEKDPYELKNCAHQPEYEEILKRMRLDLAKELEGVDDCLYRSPWLKGQLLEGKKI